MIRVGGRSFIAHETVLSKSPVFASMSRGSFEESQTRVFKLSDDDPEIFSLLIGCLYYQHEKLPDLIDLRKAFPKREAEIYQVIAELYVLADKYQIIGIQKSIVHTNMVGELHDDVSRFFRAAETIYHNTSSSDCPFRLYFRDNAPNALRERNQDVLKHIENLIHRGDDLAVDIFKAQSKAWEMLSGTVAEMILSEHEMSSTVDKLDSRFVSKERFTPVKNKQVGVQAKASAYMIRDVGKGSS